MKLAKMLIASFVIPGASVAVGRLIEQWLFGPLSPREDAIGKMWAITGAIAMSASVIVLAMILMPDARPATPDTDQPPA